MFDQVNGSSLSQTTAQSPDVTTRRSLTRLASEPKK